MSLRGAGVLKFLGQYQNTIIVALSIIAAAAPLLVTEAVRLTTEARVTNRESGEIASRLEALSRSVELQTKEAMDMVENSIGSVEGLVKDFSTMVATLEKSADGQEAAVIVASLKLEIGEIARKQDYINKVISDDPGRLIDIARLSDRIDQLVKDLEESNITQSSLEEQKFQLIRNDVERLYQFFYGTIAVLLISILLMWLPPSKRSP